MVRLREIAFPQPDRLLSMNDRLHWRAQRSRTRLWRRSTMVAALRANGVTEVQAWFVAGQVHDARQPLDAALRLVGATAQPFLPAAIVEVRLPVRDSRHRDPHNYFATVKPIIDGLVDAGLWPDDTPDWVTTVEPRLIYRGAAVTISITERLAA